MRVIHVLSTKQAWVELLVLAGVAAVVARPYLNLDPAIVPTGREYLSAVQTHHVWAWAKACGVCALWNGSVRGGYPAFADLHGSMLHPLVIVTTLLWGVIVGSKVALVVTFWLAGVAQWWLARTLELGRAARLWSGAMAIAAGHLAARMELGLFGVVLPTVSCALVFPPLLAVSRSGRRRDAIVLGMMLALAAVAGQGYMQFGLLFTLPAAGLLLVGQRERRLLLARRYGQAVGLALLLAAPFLLPFLHFLPQFVKEVDFSWANAQSFAYIPLNLVIHDVAFYSSDALQKSAYPHLTVLYVGWWPVLLAVWGLHSGRPGGERRAILYLLAVAILALWLSSGAPLAWLTRLSPSAWVDATLAGIRHVPQIGGLAVPPILALAALGLDRLLGRIWPRLRLSLADDPAARFLRVDVRWLLIFPLVAAWNSAYQFGRQWIAAAPLEEERLYPVLEALHTPDLQWVNAPWGEHFWAEPAVRLGLKQTSGIRAWNWRDHPLPESVLEANREGSPPGMSPFTVVDGVSIYTAPAGREYATIHHDDGRQTVCRAQGLAGVIDVACQSERPGLLVVKENRWSGWRAWLDGERASLVIV